MEYDFEFIDSVLHSQSNLIQAKIDKVEDSKYKITQPTSIARFEAIKSEYRIIDLDYDAYDNGYKYDRVFYCYFYKILNDLDAILLKAGLITSQDMEEEYMMNENTMGKVHQMLGLLPTDKDEDPIETVYTTNYDFQLEED